MYEPKAEFFDGVKFMWDGRDYESAEAAAEVMAEYEKEAFETRVVEGDGKFHIYTRRVVTEIEVEGTPPA